jgi:hypothetical protein
MGTVSIYNPENYHTMGRVGRRLRGWFIRLVLNRTVSIVLGLMLLVPAAWLFFGDYRWESPLTDGLQLILGATGAALLFAGLGGRRPDWIEPEDPLA